MTSGLRLTSFTSVSLRRIECSAGRTNVGAQNEFLTRAAQYPV